MLKQQMPTVNAAIKYAEKLRAQGERELLTDPYACPYMPNATEAGVRKLCQRLANQALAELPDNATDEQLAQARATGPARAIAYMRMRHKQHNAEQGDIAQCAQQSLERHTQRHRKHRQQRDKQRAHLNPGQRIDQAIARLRLIAAPAAGPIGNQTPASERNQRPAYTVDAAGRAIAIAYQAVREIEDLEDSHKLRDLDKAA